MCPSSFFLEITNITYQTVHNRVLWGRHDMFNVIHHEKLLELHNGKLAAIVSHEVLQQTKNTENMTKALNNVCGINIHRGIIFRYFE